MNIVTHTSKKVPGVCFFVSRTGSRRYLAVGYYDKILFKYHHPIKIRSAIKQIEKIVGIYEAQMARAKSGLSYDAVLVDELHQKLSEVK